MSQYVAHRAASRIIVPPGQSLMERLPEGERSDTWLTYGEQKHHVHLSQGCFKFPGCAGCCGEGRIEVQARAS